MSKNRVNFICFIVLILLCINASFFPDAIELNENLYDLFDAEAIINDNNENENVNFHITVRTIDDGNNIYVPDGYGYHYGPSIIINDDESIDAWFASPGDYGQWDWIRYRHYDGNKWSETKVVLRPNSNGEDHYSVCDPGVIYFDGYYYLAYTSTQNSDGYENNIYVARSQNPDGPYEKWNGNGWGENPVPIVEYQGKENYWGAGEGSFAIKDDKLYCYYTYISEDGDQTRVAVADLCDNWPNTMEYKGVCYNRKDGQDSCDVVYLEPFDIFAAFSISNRFSEYSGIAVYESEDGISFKQTDVVRGGISQFAHNMGISKRKDGHINSNDNLFVGYAYGTSTKSWGKWSTRFQGIKLYFYEGKISMPSKYEDSTYRELR